MASTRLSINPRQSFLIERSPNILRFLQAMSQFLKSKKQLFAGFSVVAFLAGVFVYSPTKISIFIVLFLSSHVQKFPHYTPVPKLRLCRISTARI